MTDDTSLPDFGEPLSLDDLLDFGELSESGIDSALDWWNENASQLFDEALE